MKNRSIVLLGSTAERYKGGIAQFTRYLADCLKGQSETFHFFSWYQLYPPLLSRQFVDLVSKTSTGKCRAEFLLGYLNPLSWLHFVRKVRGLKPDLILISWIHPVHSPVYLFLNWYLKRYTKAEIVYICFNVSPHESFLGARVLTWLGLRGADRCIVHGRSEEVSLQAIFPQKAITRLFLPLRNFYGDAQTTERNTTERNSERNKELLFFGMIRHYKGLDVLLRAMPAVLEKHPDARLRVVGEPFYAKQRGFDRFLDHESNPLDLIQELGLGHAVETDLRYVGNEEIPQIFSRAAVCVFPYRAATQSGVVAVAYGYNVPVIVTRVGGLPDVVVEGQSGFLCEPGNIQDLAEKIIAFLDHPIPREQVKHIAQQLSWERYLEGVLNGRSFTLETQEGKQSETKAPSKEEWRSVNAND